MSGNRLTLSIPVSSVGLTLCFPLCYSTIEILTLLGLVPLKLLSYLPLWLHILLLGVYSVIAVKHGYKIVNEGKKILHNVPLNDKHKQDP